MSCYLSQGYNRYVGGQGRGRFSEGNFLGFLNFAQASKTHKTKLETPFLLHIYDLIKIGMLKMYHMVLKLCLSSLASISCLVSLASMSCLSSLASLVSLSSLVYCGQSSNFVLLYHSRLSKEIQSDFDKGRKEKKEKKSSDSMPRHFPEENKNN